MKKLAMEEKLVVRPIVGCLVHSHFWEGPCRAGHKEEMTKEAEAAAADKYFAQMGEELKNVIPEVELMPMIDCRYEEKFVVSEEKYAEIEQDMEKADIFPSLSGTKSLLSSCRTETRALTLQLTAGASELKPMWPWTCRILMRYFIISGSGRL